MTVNTFQSRDQFTDCLRTRRSFHLRQFFNAEAVGHRMCVRTDPADPFEEIQVLDPVAAFGGFFDSAVCISEPHFGCGDNFSVHRKFKVARLLECRMLRANRDYECVSADHSLLRQFVGAATRYRRGLFD